MPTTRFAMSNMSKRFLPTPIMTQLWQPPEERSLPGPEWISADWGGNWSATGAGSDSHSEGEAPETRRACIGYLPAQSGSDSFPIKPIHVVVLLNFPLPDVSLHGSVFKEDSNCLSFEFVLRLLPLVISMWGAPGQRFSTGSLRSMRAGNLY